MDADTYREKLERDILNIIEEKLKAGEMELERAQQIARLVLDKLHPPLTLEQIYAIAPTLDDEFSELSKAIIPVMRDHEEQVKMIVAKHAEDLIKSGKIDDAINEIKQAIDK